jgi:hypothetical protein
MDGIELGEVRGVLVSAFNRDAFDMLLSDRFNFKRDREVGGGERLPFVKIVDLVLERFSEDGLDAFLIAEAAAKKPNRPDVQELYAKYAQALVGGAWAKRVDAAKLDALRKYGQLPSLDVQQGGLPVAQPAASFGDGGFQKTIRGFVKQLDVLDWAAEMLKVTKRVCRIDVETEPVGTGFLVGADAVLTNHHVLEHAISKGLGGDQIRCVFEYWKVGGKPTEGIAVQAAPNPAEWHVDSSAPLSEAQEHAGVPVPTPDQLDYALLRLEHPFGNKPVFPGGPIRGWIRVPATAPPLAKDMPMAILQHPDGEPLKLALDTQAVLSVNENRTRLRYAVNTDAGASGSPCFGLDFALVALHHLGDPHKPPAYNQGIPIAAVRERLERGGKAAALGGPPP